MVFVYKTVCIRAYTKWNKKCS